MKMITFLFVCVFALVGCTKQDAKEVLCDSGKTASGLLASQIAVQLECKNVDAIRADLDLKLIDLKVCEPAPVTIQAQGALGDAVCTQLVGALTSGLLVQIPAKWECTGGAVTEDIKAKLIASCSKAL